LLRKLIHNDKAEADTAIVSKVIAVFITIFIAILLVYTIAGSMNAHDTDKDLWGPTWDNGTAQMYNRTPMQNATNNSIDQSATVFTIAPIIAIVMVAVVILRYVGMI